MKLRYFAWVRERIGKPEEEIEPPAGIATVSDLMIWLSQRGEEYAHAFENPTVIRAAIDRAHVRAGMAEAEIVRHVEAAERRWPLLGVAVVHRYGRLEPGEEIVLVVTAAAHRQDAFAAAEFLMDYLKTRAPFWKQVELAGSGRPRGKIWVDAKQSDDALADRWTPRRAAE